MFSTIHSKIIRSVNMSKHRKLISIVATTTTTTAAAVTAAAIATNPVPSFISATSLSTSVLTSSSSSSDINIGQYQQQPQQRQQQQKRMLSSTEINTKSGIQQPNRLTTIYQRMKDDCPADLKAYAVCVEKANNNDELGLQQGSCQNEFNKVQECFQRTRTLTTPPRATAATTTTTTNNPSNRDTF